MARLESTLASPAQELTKREKLAAVDRAIQQLPVNLRIPLVLVGSGRIFVWGSCLCSPDKFKSCRNALISRPQSVAQAAYGFGSLIPDFSGRVTFVILGSVFR